MKIVINSCYGGFSLSNKAIRRIMEIQGLPCFFYKRVGEDYTNCIYIKCEEIPQDTWYTYALSKDYGSKLSCKQFDTIEEEDFSCGMRGINRDDPILIRVVEELGGDKGEAAGDYAKLKIVEIPNDVEWEIEEYDGIEWVSEVHRTWS